MKSANAHKMVTLKEVAEAAGVSMKTVSRVINSSPDVAEHTRQHIEHVIERMNYQPNRLARSLASGKTNTIGVLVHHAVHQIFEYPFFNELLGGISQCLNENKLDLLLRFMDGETSYTELYTQQRVDGLIVTNAPINIPEAEQAALLNIPCVFTSQIALENNPSHFVDSDFEGAVIQALNHLIELGHRHIALLAGPEHLALSHLRMKGYRKALAACGLTVREDLMQFNNLFIEGDSVCAKLTPWLKMVDAPTAIIASDDMTAVNVIQALNERGYRVPQDLSVFGFDDTLFAKMTTPRLSSMRQQAHRKGCLAVRTLLEVIEGETKSPIHTELAMELMVRDSTGPAPSQ